MNAAGPAKKMAGFTLIEMLLSVAILSILATLSLPIYNSFATNNDLDLTGQQVVGSIRRAQMYARAMHEDSAWSVEVTANEVTLFKGTTFGTRDTGFDEVITLPDTVTVSGLTEIQFSKLSALPNTTGSITLTSNASDSRVITVNAKGRVDY